MDKGVENAVAHITEGSHLTGHREGLLDEVVFAPSLHKGVKTGQWVETIVGGAMQARGSLHRPKPGRTSCSNLLDASWLSQKILQLSCPLLHVILITCM